MPMNCVSKYYLDASKYEYGIQVEKKTHIQKRKSISIILALVWTLSEESVNHMEMLQILV